MFTFLSMYRDQTFIGQTESIHHNLIINIIDLAFHSIVKEIITDQHLNILI